MHSVPLKRKKIFVVTSREKKTDNQIFRYTTSRAELVDSLPKAMQSKDVANAAKETIISFGHISGEDQAPLPGVSIRHYSCFVLLSQNCCSLSGSFMVPYKFLKCLFYICEIRQGFFNRDCIESINPFGGEKMQTTVNEQH